jgi:DNA/RNA endonuclease YhcR with UshA esterase domain
MKSWRIAAMILLLGVATASLTVAQKPAEEAAPKYDVSAETKFKAVVDEVKDRECPISRGMGVHLMVRSDGKVYELHVAPTKFVKQYEVAFEKGDELEIKGIKTKFQGVDAILVREIKRGNDDFLFRDPEGKPIW